MLSELQDRLRGSCNVDVSPMTIYRTLKRRGFTRKKITRPALERDETDRAQYQLIIGMNYEPEQLVFVDESAFDRRTAQRPYGWSPIGTRSRWRDFFIRGKRYVSNVRLLYKLIFVEGTLFCQLSRWMGLLLWRSLLNLSLLRLSRISSKGYLSKWILGLEEILLLWWTMPVSTKVRIFGPW